MNLDDRVEDYLRQMRTLLCLAAKAEAEGEYEAADAYGARAAMKLSIAIHLQRKSNLFTL